MQSLTTDFLLFLVIAIISYVFTCMITPACDCSHNFKKNHLLYLLFDYDHYCWVCHFIELLN